MAENRINRFNRMFGAARGKTLNENSIKSTENADNRGEKNMTDKKITLEMREGLNALGIDDETINGLTYDAAAQILKDKTEISETLDNITDAQKITSEIREKLNALGIDDSTINGLTLNSALDILKDKNEINEALDKLALNDDELRPTEDKSAPNINNENLDWIDLKVKDYETMKDDGNTSITTIMPNKETQTFTAEVDNATVVYSSPNDVSVSKGASYKVFDTMMKEPSNKNKAVRIPEDASEEFKTNLFVAAVLNGHKVNGAEELKLDEATFEKIDLTEEQKALVLSSLPKQENPQTNEQPEINKTTEENETIPGPYNPLNHKINHVLERKNMLNALANGATEDSKEKQNPTKPTYIFKNINHGEQR